MDDKDLMEQELVADTLYRGRIINLRNDTVQLPNGTVAHREYVEHMGGAAILPIDDTGNVLLVRQYRYPYRRILYEIPAGKLEKGEAPDTTALRELEEETGYTARDLESYGVFLPSPGYTNEKLYLYVATGLQKRTVHPDEDEFVDIVRLPFDEVLRMVLDGEIQDGKTCCTVLRYAYVHNIK